MKTGVLTRTMSSDVGTFGDLVINDVMKLKSGELPWRDNQHGISCIPTGTYIAKHFVSPKHGPCYLLQNVPDRSDVEIHAANWMGDKSKGYKSELLGCIALGMTYGKAGGQEGVFQSKEAIEHFLEVMDGEDLELTIVSKPE